jgi:hypothetical protein
VPSIFKKFKCISNILRVGWLKNFMPINYELEPSLGRQLTGVVQSTAERVNLRRAGVGKDPVDAGELVERTLRMVTENNRGSIMWNQPSLVRDRARLKALNPTVALYAALCEDGRLDRPTRGAVASVKTEHAHITLQYVESKGIWIPKGITQQALEDPIRTPLNFNKIHNRHCAAWDITIHQLRSPLWDYVTAEQKRHILEISEKDPVLGNLIFSELSNTRAYDNYYEDVHGVRRRTAVSMVYDPHTTGVELVTPLVRFDKSGKVVSLPKPDEMRRFNTTSLVEQIVDYKDRTQDPNIPELGKYKDNYYDPDIFPEFFHELTDLTVALSTGKVEKEDGTVWTVPEPLMELRRRFIDKFIDGNGTQDDGYKDLTPDSREAFKHHVIYATWREFLLKGQTKTRDHEEVAASGSDTGSNVLKNTPWLQSIRYTIPVGSREGVTRFLVARTVMDRNRIDGELPHLSFIVSNSSSRVRELFDLTEGDPDVSDTITTGAMFPIGGVLDDEGMFLRPVPETVRSI